MQRTHLGRIRRHLVLAFLGLAIFVAGATIGYLAKPEALARPAQARSADEPTEFRLFWEAWDLVVEHFVDRERVDFTAMTYGAIQGMLDSLGDENHTTFFSPEVAEQQASALEGAFEGIGAYVTSDEGLFHIVAPIHGSPAERAGLLAGDMVIAVDGEEITGLPTWEVISRVRGPSGSTVSLTVIHAGETKTHEIIITRGHIDIESVLWARVPETDFVYLQITQFATDTNHELRSVLEEIRLADSAEQPIRGMLLDLRNNPGGYLNEALMTGNQFLEEGAIILHERDAEGQLSTIRAHGSGDVRSIPLVVLVNAGSASAAEILAGALQENQRGKLVGETTLGTGTVLRVFNLSDGSVVRLGVTNWLTPQQKLIKDQGITPDVTIQQAPSVEQLDSFALAAMQQDEWLTHEDRQFRAGLMLLRMIANRQVYAEVDGLSGLGRSE